MLSTPLTIPLLDKGVDELPLVLLGPMLRRVEQDQVNVFMVLSRYVTSATLKVFSMEGGIAGPTLMQVRSTDYVRIGKYLYGHMLRATPVSPYALDPGRIYHYDIRFEIGTSEKGMLDTGVLTWSSEVGNLNEFVAFGSDVYPSFVVPVNDPGKLNVLHGSCRKAHGGESDALLSAGALLNVTYNNAEQRPQMMFMTGDQIYGDDVADVLRYITMQIMPVLMGYTEDVPDVPSGTDLGPGKREAVMRTYGNFSCYDGYGKSHCIRFEDFVGLYMLAWSDILWPSLLPDYSTVGSPEKKAAFNGERAKVAVFRAGMKGIRKILANLPVLTVFDDHEVCDDWFLNRQWTEGVMGTNFGRRVIQNGLSAFAVFQAWGNTPERFEGFTTGRSILDYITQISTEGGSVPATWNSLGSIILPTLTTIGPDLAGLTGGMQWDYCIHYYGAYSVLALNSRTNRSFQGTSTRAAASLLSPQALHDQMDVHADDLANVPLLILLAGAPVFGHPWLEERIQPMMIARHNAEYEKNEGVGESGEAHWDMEAWIFQRDTFEALLERLAEHERVVILSGDVHYGFSIAVDYWDKRQGSDSASEKRSVFVQLTSSAMKNSEFKTKASRALPNTEKRIVGWDLENEPPSSAQSVTFHNEYLVDDREEGEVYSKTPKFEYRTYILEDKRPFQERGMIEELGLNEWEDYDPFTESGWVRAAEIGLAPVAAGMATMRRMSHYQGLVGTDNMGQVIFQWSSSAQSVSHYFWYDPMDGDDVRLPYTRHHYSLVPKAFADAARPTDDPE